MKYEDSSTEEIRNLIIEKFIKRSYVPGRRIIDQCLDEIYFKQWTLKITALGNYHGGALQFEILDPFDTDLGYYIDKGIDQMSPNFERSLCISILIALDKRKFLNGH